jgi:hypothetical protein
MAETAMGRNRHGPKQSTRAEANDAKGRVDGSKLSAGALLMAGVAQAQATKAQQTVAAVLRFLSPSGE